MAARSVDDRLPWLDTPRAAAPSLARRVRTPLLIVLGLFLAGTIALMAYLTGRSTAPVATPSPPPAPVIAQPVRLPPRAPVPTAVEPVVAAPAPVAAQAPAVREAAPVAPTKPLAARPKSKRKAIARRPRAPTVRPERRPEPQLVQRIAPAPAAPVAARPPLSRTAWPARPFAGPRGRVIQLDAYTTKAQADAAWWRLARVYPYLATLPRLVTATGPTPGRPRIYRLRLAASSRGEARALCRTLHRLGRGCIVLR